jgi:phosphoenolpyruvate carboxylase
MGLKLLPPHSDRSEDEPLHDDVRWLASTLGDVIRRLEGEACFAAVEDLRTSCRARRQDVEDAPALEDILSAVDDLSLETAAKVARAFALFFILINAAEQVHRVRRRRHYQKKPDTPPQPASFLWAMQQLKERQLDAAGVADALARLEARPVFTAHPTEATRHTVLDLQARVADNLLRLSEAPPVQRADLEDALRSEVELLWLTEEVRRDRPSVWYEVENVLWYLQHRLLETEERLAKEVRRAFARVFEKAWDNALPLRIGSWVGGDRDGNPHVTSEITLKAARETTRTVIRAYRSRVEDLAERLSLSTRIKAAPDALQRSLEQDRTELPEIWDTLHQRHAEEPIRLKLGFISARLGRNLEQIDAWEDGRDETYPQAYRDAAGLEQDLLLLDEALTAAGADHARHPLIDSLLIAVRIHGFFGYVLDIRQDAKVHAQAWDDIAAALEAPDFDERALETELLGRRPLIGEHLPLSKETRETYNVFRVMRRIQQEVGEQGVSTYILSMTHQAEDLLQVLLLAREAGLVDLAHDPPQSHLDVVPLFETLDDLRNAGSIVQSLFANRAYQRQLQARGSRQEIMIGYSDSTKDAGILPASWALYCAQEKIVELCRKAGVSCTFFHGRGGTVGRGGGSPVFQGLTALPPGSIKARIKVTEQGEVISQKYGLIPIAERSLEVMMTGTLLASAKPWYRELQPDEESRFREVMERLVDLALPVYRQWVEDERLFRFFMEVTPVRELEHVHFGSRPAYRPDGGSTMRAMRAIPWVFGWTQVRLNLPAWLGVGTALSAVAREQGGLEVLRQMARNWVFFNDLLSKIEMICAKSDLEIAAAHVRHLREEDMKLLVDLEEEFNGTVQALLEIRRSKHLLMDQPLLQTAITHRDPYIDPLSILQINLLRRKQRLDEEDSQWDLLNRAIATTLNGIAQGLRNTG